MRNIYLQVLAFLLLAGNALYAAPCNFTVSITKQNVDCHGNATGSATALVSGTTGPYNFLWSNGQTTENIANLIAQTYFVKVTDKNGCELIEFVNIEQPDAISYEYEKENVGCFGENTGSVVLEANGGFGNLKYQWSNGVQLPNNINLYAGTYNLTISDDNFCSVSDTFVITQPEKLLETHVIQHVLGYGLSDGAIDITVDGGVMPYNYNWYANGELLSQLEDIYGLPANDYHAMVYDFNNCLLEATITVNQPPLLESWYEVTDVNCKEGTDGSIDLTVVGGVPPYTYTWANSEIILNEETQDIQNLKKDNY